MHNRVSYHSYLVKRYYGNIHKIKVIEITKTSIKFQSEFGNTFRETKEDAGNYMIIEDLGGPSLYDFYLNK